MGVYLSKEALVTHKLFGDHCLITVIATHKSQTRMLGITISVPDFAADGQCKVEQEACNSSCESLTHPCEELLMLLLLPLQ